MYQEDFLLDTEYTKYIKKEVFILMKEWFEVCLTEIFGSKSFYVKLPMPTAELIERIRTTFKDREYIIDVVDNHGLRINEFTNIESLNEFAQFLEDNSVEEKTLECIAYSGQDSLDEVRKIIENESYSIISSGDNFSDEEKDLGEALYSNNLLDIDLPQDLVDKGYINFTAIGRDAMISFGWNYVGEHKSYCRTW